MCQLFPVNNICTSTAGSSEPAKTADELLKHIKSVYKEMTDSAPPSSGFPNVGSEFTMDGKRYVVAGFGFSGVTFYEKDAVTNYSGIWKNDYQSN